MGFNIPSIALYFTNVPLLIHFLGTFISVSLTNSEINCTNKDNRNSDFCFTYDKLFTMLKSNQNEKLSSIWIQTQWRTINIFMKYTWNNLRFLKWSIVNQWIKNDDVRLKRICKHIQIFICTIEIETFTCHSSMTQNTRLDKHQRMWILKFLVIKISTKKETTPIRIHHSNKWNLYIDSNKDDGCWNEDKDNLITIQLSWKLHS